MLTSPRLMFRILLASHFFAVGYLLTSDPKITVNATSGEICFTTSSNDQCSVANLIRYNVSIADITGNLIFKSEDIAESSCVVVNSSILLIPQCGPYKISALAFDDYNTYDYVYHMINPGFKLKIGNGSNCDLCSCLKANIQLQIFILPYSPLTSTITVNYDCSTKYITPPEIMFITDTNNRTMVKTNISCSFDGYIFYTETGCDHLPQVCGYWTFSNQTPFISCPINCATKLTTQSGYNIIETMPTELAINNMNASAEIPIVVALTSMLTILTVAVVTLVIGILLPLKRSKFKTSHPKKTSYYWDDERFSLSNYKAKISTSKDTLSTSQMSTGLSRPKTTYGCDESSVEDVTMPFLRCSEVQQAKIILPEDESFKNNPPSRTVINDEFYLFYHTKLECDHNGLEHTIIGHNITLRIPKQTIGIGDKLYFEVAVLMFGPFTFPKNTWPISPILWLCPDDTDYQLKKPFMIILPHFLSSQAVEKMKPRDIQFAKAKHELSQSTKYEFQILNNKPLFASSGGRNFCVLQIQHCCFYCLMTNKSIIGAEYCLIQIERPLQSRSDKISFLVTYFLDTCLRAVEEQYPQKEGYSICHYSTFQFKSEGDEACLEMEVPIQHNDYIVGTIPNPPKIWRSDVDFQSDDTVTNMYQKHKRKVYPPRILMVATAKTEGAVFKLHTKFKGCSKECELDRDLCFPLDNPPSPTSACSTGAESHDILSEKPSLRTAYKELLPLASYWKKIGVLLGVPKSVLNRIKSDEEESSDRLLEMLSEWVKQVDPPPTWTALADAVEPFDKGKSVDICRRIPKRLP